MLQLSLLIFCYNPLPNPSSQGISPSLPALSKQVVMKENIGITVLSQES